MVVYLITVEIENAVKDVGKNSKEKALIMMEITNFVLSVASH